MSGALSTKSQKTTEEDGSEVEQSERRAAVKGAGGANMKANAAAGAEARSAGARQTIRDGES